MLEWAGSEGTPITILVVQLAGAEPRRLLQIVPLPEGLPEPVEVCLGARRREVIP